MMNYFSIFMLFLVDMMLFGMAAFFCHHKNPSWPWFLGIGCFALLLTLGHLGNNYSDSDNSDE